MGCTILLRVSKVSGCKKGSLTSLQFDRASAQEKCNLKVFEKNYNFLANVIQLWGRVDPPSEQDLQAAIYCADEMCSFALTGAQTAKASETMSKEEAEKLWILWDWTRQQFHRTPAASKSTLLLRLKMTMARMTSPSSIRDPRAHGSPRAESRADGPELADRSRSRDSAGSGDLDVPRRVSRSRSLQSISSSQSPYIGRDLQDSPLKDSEDASKDKIIFELTQTVQRLEKKLAAASVPAALKSTIEHDPLDAEPEGALASSELQFTVPPPRPVLRRPLACLGRPGSLDVESQLVFAGSNVLDDSDKRPNAFAQELRELEALSQSAMDEIGPHDIKAHRAVRKKKSKNGKTTISKRMDDVLHVHIDPSEMFLMKKGTGVFISKNGLALSFSIQKEQTYYLLRNREGKQLVQYGPKTFPGVDMMDGESAKDLFAVGAYLVNKAEEGMDKQNLLKLRNGFAKLWKLGSFQDVREDPEFVKARCLSKNA